MSATAPLQSRRFCRRITFIGFFLVVILLSVLCLRNYQQAVTFFLVPCGGDDNPPCSAKLSWKDSTENLLIDSDVTSNSTKRILFWVPFFSSPDYYFGFGRKPFSRCPVSNCETTNNRSLIATSDAVIFHFRDTEYRDLPQWRSPSQRWVFFLMESPSHTSPDLRPFGGLFNWTMTYRSDSDIIARYAYVRPIAPDKAIGGVEGNHSGTAKRRRKKRRLVSWLVSNCHTKGHRENYVHKLLNYTTVDIFGKCNAQPCEKGGACQEHVLSDYKFYLSFENSICRDYVTEKFFKVLGHDTVPVVYGGANYGEIAPPNSYIDARDFASPRHLADFLKMLDTNDTLYEQYFRWKSKFRVVEESSHFCDLCAKLHGATNKDIKVYDDIYDWWITRGNCISKLTMSGN